MDSPAAVSRKKSFGRWLFLLALLAAISAGVWWWLQDQEQENALLTIAVEQGDLEDLVTATGVLQPGDFVDVGAQVSGQLQALYVRTGDVVRQGDLLAEIDPTLYLARVDATRAQLRNQRAQLMERESQLLLAEIQNRRQQNLLREEATSLEAAQTAEATLRSAKAQIEALNAQIEQTESTLRAEEANLDYARIYAPMDGTVVTIDARQGQTLNASQQAPLLMRIADLSVMMVEAQVSEADIGKLRASMPVYFTTLGSPRRFRSELERIEPTPVVENNVVLYNAVFEVPNPDGRLMTNMTAQVFFINAEARDALLVPLTTLRFPDPRDRTQAVALVLGRNGQPVERSVTVGVTNRVQAQILDGLEAGDRVVSGSRGGQTGSSGGQRIRVQGMRF